MGKLDGRIAVITGGSDGMGRSTARLFVGEGATVVITGRNQDTLDAAVWEIGGAIEAFRGDIGNLADLDALKVHVENKHGRVDVLFANAGGARLGPFEQVTEEDFDYTFDTNAKGTFFTVQKLLPLMPAPRACRTSACTRRRRPRSVRSHAPLRRTSRGGPSA
jgi:NAD(P)-dependent dehydrogenase (short-subunit alcohol dehydrogenase family)